MAAAAANLMPTAETPLPAQRDLEGDWHVKDDVEFEKDVAVGGAMAVTGDVTGANITPLGYACISFDDNASATTIPLVDSYVLVSDFDTDGPDTVSNSDQANNKIDVGASGTYEVTTHISATAGGTNKVYEWDVVEVSASSTAITAATQANPVVVTAAGHGLSNGDLVKITGVVGMTEINDRLFKVADKTDDTFELQDDGATDIDGSGFTAYTSDGTVQAVTLTGCHTHRKFATADQGSCSGGILTTLTSGTDLELYVKGTTDATNLTHESASLFIKKA